MQTNRKRLIVSYSSLMIIMAAGSTGPVVTCFKRPQPHLLLLISLETIQLLYYNYSYYYRTHIHIPAGYYVTNHCSCYV